MSKKRIYSKRKRLNLIPIIIVLLIVVFVFFVVWGGTKLLSAKDYTEQINEVFENEILKTTGSVCSVSKVDINVYSNKGIKYTNRHENIIKLNSFDSSIETETEKASKARILLENLKNLQKTDSVNELLKEENGYYWIRIDLTANDKFLFISDEEYYFFDLYYDKEDKKIYVKEKYFDEFSMKNNTTKLSGYVVDEQYEKLIEDLASTK
ncbi:MAG: hypothetical protein K0Q97_1847 [Bacillota bacterium]|jgi:hypothetical protein|nr:hypothetical protein [Bacillota bacterium]